MARTGNEMTQDSGPVKDLDAGRVSCYYDFGTLRDLPYLTTRVVREDLFLFLRIRAFVHGNRRLVRLWARFNRKGSLLAGKTRAQYQLQSSMPAKQPTWYMCGTVRPQENNVPISVEGVDRAGPSSYGDGSS